MIFRGYGAFLCIIDGGQHLENFTFNHLIFTDIIPKCDS